MTAEGYKEPEPASPALKSFLAFARFMFLPASVLAAIGGLGCLAIAGLGEFGCSLPADIVFPNGSKDFFGFALMSVCLLVMIRGMGAHTPELVKKLGDAIDDRRFPSVRIFSTRVSFSLVVLFATFLATFVSLLVPIGIVIYEARTVWSACVMAASGSA